MERSVIPEKESGKNETDVKLMVSGWVWLSDNDNPVQVIRGQSILSIDDQELGKVAALLIRNGNLYATDILLSRLPEKQGYWILPVEHIQHVGKSVINVDLPSSTIPSLAVWHEE